MMGTAVADGQIALVVNGAERRIPAGSSLADLLTGLKLDPRVVVIEHNGTILRDRATFASVPLSADDTIEIVHFVGGG
jgi:thiamine biosynthesis protein ThiS